MNLPVGSYTQVYFSGGARSARILAVLGKERLVEYELEDGTTGLRIIAEDDPGLQSGAAYGRSVSYNGLPVKWLRALVQTGLNVWIGNPDERISRPRKPQELLEQHTRNSDKLLE